MSFTLVALRASLAPFSKGRSSKLLPLLLLRLYRSIVLLLGMLRDVTANAIEIKFKKHSQNSGEELPNARL